MAYAKEAHNPNRNRESSSSGWLLAYDPVARKWVEISPVTSSTEEGSGVTPDTTPQTTSTVVNNNPISKVNSKGEADKEYIDIEFNTLIGDLTVTASEKSIRVKVGDTIRLEGVGKYLSGLYFVTAISRSLSKDSGYSHSFSILKTGFGDSLKSNPSTEISSDQSSSRDEPTLIPKEATAFEAGDTVRIIGDDAVYTNDVRVPAWVKQKDLTIQQLSSDGTKALVMPITSWVYLKYLQKY